MKTVFITGHTGFIGQNLIKKFNSEYQFIRYNKIEIDLNMADVVMNLAGKAHDLRKNVNSREYYDVNTSLSNNVYDAFLASNAKVFITMSSVKGVADVVSGILTEDEKPNPITHYGKSKFLAEEYILSKPIPEGKRVYILRPCMIHGPHNKGNLNLLYKMVSKNVPWPLGAFDNKRSFCSVENLLFVIDELIKREDIPSGIYNISDNTPLSTNDLVGLIAESKGFVPKILNIPVGFVKIVSKLGDYLHLPINSERLQKLTESYIVSNQKILNALNKQLPITSEEGLKQTFRSFI